MFRGALKLPSPQSWKNPENSFKTGFSLFFSKQFEDPQQDKGIPVEKQIHFLLFFSPPQLFRAEAQPRALNNFRPKNIKGQDSTHSAPQKTGNERSGGEDLPITAWFEPWGSGSSVIPGWALVLGSGCSSSSEFFGVRRFSSPSLRGFGFFLPGFEFFWAVFPGFWGFWVDLKGFRTLG